MRVQFKKFSAFGKIPQKATPGSACFNIFSSSDLKLRPGETKQISLDISFKFSEKLCCRIHRRSSLSLIPIFIGGGVIEPDYLVRGNISVILTNFGSENVEVKIREKVAQMFLKSVPVFWGKVSEFSDSTARGACEFGSTGR